MWQIKEQSATTFDSFSPIKQGSCPVRDMLKAMTGENVVYLSWGQFISVPWVIKIKVNGCGTWESPLLFHATDVISRSLTYMLSVRDGKL
jgi:hypothetical protein